MGDELIINPTETC